MRKEAEIALRKLPADPLDADMNLDMDVNTKLNVEDEFLTSKETKSND